MLGSIVNRMKFSAWIVFTGLWLTFIYCPIAHFVGSREIGSMGALDFAGGTWLASKRRGHRLVLALVLGKRIGYGQEAMFPSSIALTALGAACCGSGGSDSMPAANWQQTGLPHRHLW